MRVVDIIGAFLTGLVAIAAVSVLVRPGSQTAQVIGAFGKGVQDTLGAAKA